MIENTTIDALKRIVADYVAEVDDNLETSDDQFEEYKLLYHNKAIRDADDKNRILAHTFIERNLEGTLKLHVNYVLEQETINPLKFNEFLKNNGSHWIDDLESPLEGEE